MYTRAVMDAMLLNYLSYNIVLILKPSGLSSPKHRLLYSSYALLLSHPAMQTLYYVTVVILYERCNVVESIILAATAMQCNAPKTNRHIL